MIDLRSDTVTRPTAGMRAAMASAIQLKRLGFGASFSLDVAVASAWAAGLAAETDIGGGGQVTSLPVATVMLRMTSSSMLISKSFAPPISSRT